MRLVYLSADPGIPYFGAKGASVHVREMVSAFSRNADAVNVLTYRLEKGRPPGPGVVIAGGEPDGGEVVRIHEIGRQVEKRSVGSSEGKTERREISLLAVNDEAASTLGRLHRSGFVEAIYERYSLWSVAGAMFAEQYSIPYVVEVNAPLVQEQKQHRSLALESTARFIERNVFRAASKLVVVSSELRDYVCELGVDSGRIEVLPNGFGEGFRSSGGMDGTGETPCRKNGEFWIGFVGSLKPWHGVGDLLKAFQQLHRKNPTYRLLIVGGGPLLKPIRKKLRDSMPGDSFCLTGPVEHGRVPEYLSLLDVAVAPYPASDGFYFSPMKVIEYAAMGKAIIASSIGQISELFKHRESAWLTEPGNVDEIVSGVEKLRDSPELRSDLGQRARRVVAGRSWESVAGRVLGLIREIASDTSVRSTSFISEGGA